MDSSPEPPRARRDSATKPLAWLRKIVETPLLGNPIALLTLLTGVIVAYYAIGDHHATRAVDVGGSPITITSPARDEDPLVSCTFTVTGRGGPPSGMNLIVATQVAGSDQMIMQGDVDLDDVDKIWTKNTVVRIPGHRARKEAKVRVMAYLMPSDQVAYVVNLKGAEHPAGPMSWVVSQTPPGDQQKAVTQVHVAAGTVC